MAATAPPRPAPAAAPVAPATPRAPRRAGILQSFSLRPGPGTPWPLFVSTLRSVLYARKTLFLLLLLLLPVYITFIIHGAVGMDKYEHNDYWGGAAPGASKGLLWFQDGTFGILFPLLIPLLVAVFSTATIGEEVEGKTLPYLFTRPVYRNWILLAKATAVYLGVFLVAVAALTTYWFVAVGLTESPFKHIGQLFGYWWVMALTVLATGGVFLFLGVLWRRSIILITIYLFVWEFFLSNAPARFFKRASIVSYERPILLAITGRTRSLEDIGVGYLSADASTLVLLGLAVLGLLAALVVVSTKDYNV